MKLAIAWLQQVVNVTLLCVSCKFCSFYGDDLMPLLLLLSLLIMRQRNNNNSVDNTQKRPYTPLLSYINTLEKLLLIYLYI